MESIWQEIRFSCRSLFKSPILSCTIILTLALAIGTNTSVFTILNEILLKSVPFEDSDRIVTIRQEPMAITTETYRELIDSLKQGPFFEEVAALTGVGISLNHEGSTPTRVISFQTTKTLQTILKIQPKLGRLFREEDSQSKPIPMILSYSCWKKRFEGDYQVIGRTVRVDGEPATIIGVMPKSLEDFFVAEIWLPFSTISNRMIRPVFFVGKLKQSTNLSAAQSYTKTVAKHFPVPSDYKVTLTTLGDRKYDFQKESLPVLYLWIGVAAFILFIACANVVNLLLARGSRREKEISVRISLGATRLQIIRLLLMESLILSALGGIAGLILSVWAKDIFGQISFIETATIDSRVLLFTALIALIAGIIAGILPALQVSRTDLNTSLKQEGSRRLKTWLLLSLGIVGFIISMIGIFAVISYSVASRRQEIGVRMAIGAQRSDILKMISRQGAILAIFGLFIGVVAAVALTRFMSSMLYGITPTDPETFLSVCFFFFAAALVASYIPARRASRIDPVITLRHE